MGRISGTDAAATTSPANGGRIVSTDADGANSDTPIWVSKELKDRIRELKPFDSMSYNDLLADMADHYEAVREQYDGASARALAEGGTD